MRTTIYIGLFIGFIIGMISLAVLNEKQILIVKKCKVIELQQQQLISGYKDGIITHIRYLIVTDKETFICESSLVNGKYDNSSLFWSLEKGQTYDFKVCGFGKSFLFDYRNILETINKNTQ